MTHMTPNYPFDGETMVGKVSEAKNRLVADSLLHPLLAASWERSMKHGLKRRDHALFNNTVSRALGRRIAEENHRLLSHATPEMVKLYGGLGSTRWLALCVNAGGQLIGSIGDRASAPRELRTLMHPGRSLVEAELGTTAPGCVLEVGRPVVVTRGEHFLFELASFFCASAPIAGPDGKLVGALDISGIDVEALPLANDMVVLAARAIENSMLSDMGACALLHFHCDERLLGTPFEALVAVEPNGAIAGANRAARQLLSLPSSGAVTTPLELLFESVPVNLLQHTRAHHGEKIRVRAHTGAVAYLTVEHQPGPSRSRPALRLGPPVSTLRSGRLFVLKDENLAKNFEIATHMLRHGLPVLLEGETGTGKELFARALHEAVRPHGPFLAVNCAAIPEGLIEAELFGYADGAFTGGRKGGASGKIEHAQGGVLFLDEIGDMPVAMQSRLLRVVQERSITRIGDSREMAVDVLVISATHHRLEQLVARGEFREALFYRLNGFRLRLPALRERKDVVEIIEALLRRWDSAEGANAGCAELGELITSRALARLLGHSWPGNIRQLEQTIRALTALRRPHLPIDMTDLPEDLRGVQGDDESCGFARNSKPSLLDDAENRVIQQALRDHGNNISSAARALDISRTTLYRKLKHSGQSARH